MSALTQEQLRPLVSDLQWFFGDVIARHARDALVKGPQISRDKGDGDLVGLLDLKVQRLLIKFLSRFFPGANIVSEEDVGNGNLKDGFVWLLDPIDGTNTLQSGIPLFGSQLALLIEGVVVFMAVYLPIESYYGKTGFTWAARGHGAWEQTADGPRKLHVSATDQLKNATLRLEGPSKVLMTSPLVYALSGSVRRIRSLQAMCWSMAQIARGSQHPAASADLLLALNNKSWDNLPACLLVEEAGGRVTDLEGNPWSVDNFATLLFSNGHLHDDALAVTRSRAVTV